MHPSTPLSIIARNQHGTQAEGWGRTGDFAGRDIPLLMKAMQLGAVFQAHGTATCEHGGDPDHPAVQTELAAFLIGMGPHAYFLCGRTLLREFMS